MNTSAGKLPKFSGKFPILEHIFNDLTHNGTDRIGQDITFTLGDVKRAYQFTGIPRPSSSSNIIIDLIRKDRGITKRLPQSIIDKGYDLRHLTGRAHGQENHAGVFIYVGFGNNLYDWLHWPNAPHRQMTIRSGERLVKILPFLRKDEAALFSVLDYSDALSYAIHGTPGSVFRVQNPLKWQPNEIDGLYFSDFLPSPELFPIEAKALSTNDDIYFPQIFGAFQLMSQRFKEIHIVPIGIKMVPNGFWIARLKENQLHTNVELDEFIQVILDPPISGWQSIAYRREKK